MRTKVAAVEAGDRRVAGTEITDERIIQRVVAGETNLYGILADRYGPRIYRLVRRIVENRMDAEDVVQEAHMRALMYLHQFGGRCRFATWLSRVAANEAFRQLRRQRSMRRVFGNAACDPVPLPVPAHLTSGPENSVLEQEARDVLRRALSELPPQYRTVFLLREVEQADTAEVARRLRIRSENVRLRLHRARRMLRRTIGSYYQ